jgi:hypothetical protein
MTEFAKPVPRHVILPRVRFGKPRWPRGSKIILGFVVMTGLTFGLSIIAYLGGKDITTTGLGFILPFLLLWFCHTFSRIAAIGYVGAMAADFAQLPPVLHGVFDLFRNAAWLGVAYHLWQRSRDGGSGDGTSTE